MMWRKSPPNKENYVKCPECDAWYHKKGYGNHKDSRICEVQAAIKEREKNDEVRLRERKIINFLKENDMYIEYDYSQMCSWTYARRWGLDVFQKRWWTKRKIKDMAETQVLPKYSTDRYEKYNKLWEDYYHLIVQHNEQTFVFNKDNSGKMQKYRFYVGRKNMYLFDLDGERVGERLYKNDLPKEVREALVACEI